MFLKLPAAWLTGVRLTLIDEDKFEVKVRFKWINQNPYRSMFWAVQGMAAELTTGMLLTKCIQDSNANISMLLVSNKSSFRKKAVGKITFTCSEGKVAKQLINSTIQNITSKAFCNTMMSDGMTAKQKNMDVIDIAQMIEKAEDL